MTQRWGVPAVRLTLARAEIQEIHPGTTAARAVLPSELLPKLEKRLRDAVSQGTLDELGITLTPRELRGLVKGLILWPELEEATAYLLQTQDCSGLALELWKAWQSYPLSSPIRNTLLTKFRLEVPPPAPLTSEAILLESWVSSEDPGESIRSWLDDRGLSFSDLEGISTLPLAPDTPLTRLIREAVLCNGSAGQLRAEGPRRLTDWFWALTPSPQATSGQNYLRKLPESEWHKGFMEVIRSVFGLPKSPRIPTFWDPLSSEIRKAFQKHFMKKQLKKMLGDDDRFRFWVGWVDSGAVEDIQQGTAGGVPYGIIDFERFGVVEFFETGNAAYFYPPKKLQRITAGGAYHPSDLKEKMFLHGGPNRFVHYGTYDQWEGRANKMVNRWLSKSAKK